MGYVVQRSVSCRHLRRFLNKIFTEIALKIPYILKDIFKIMNMYLNENIIEIFFMKLKTTLDKKIKRFGKSRKVTTTHYNFKIFFQNYLITTYKISR